VSGLWSRLVVGAALLPGVLALVYLGGWWLFALAAAAALLALHEFWQMTRLLRPLALAGYLGAAATLLGAQLGGVAWALGGFLTTFALAFVLKGLAETKTTTTVAVGATVLGAGWIGLGLGFVILIRELEQEGRLLAFTVLLTVWASDTAAYFVGRFLGRHKLAPVTSPGKTWEGFVAGTVVAVAVPFFALYEETTMEIWETLVLGGVLALAAPTGDLFESALKRDMQVKDTGRLLGGHGGMLDRIDALLFAGVAAYYTIAALGHA
jgi:phosphatidate cytidylyltransferase